MAYASDRPFEARLNVEVQDRVSKRMSRRGRELRRKEKGKSPETMMRDMTTRATKGMR